MAKLSILEIAPYLHDGEVDFLRYDYYSSQKIRTLSMTVLCTEDAGLSEINNKKLKLIIQDVVFINFRAWGYTVGKLVLDGWDSGVSEATEADLLKVKSAGIAIPNSKYTLTFHDGSVCELVCSHVSVEIDE
ncbi:MAG: hypothetical protein ACFCD0_01090 [Gemmataceae bacterium]